jgi:outer membrane biogenesis lipoprotein LolB
MKIILVSLAMLMLLGCATTPSAGPWQVHPWYPHHHHHHHDFDGSRHQ